MHKLGLLGRNISYSFSKGYFSKKFETESLPYVYENFDLERISEFNSVLQNNPELIGFNVTIPYKEQIIPLLNTLDDTAKEIGAVNTVKVQKDGTLKGYNTDYYGFQASLQPFLKAQHKTALILGTGGASKAVAYALKNLGISFEFVSRTPRENVKFIYKDLTEDIIKEHTVIINCTPLGTHPNVNQCPDIPYDGLTPDHLVYDLIYNPEQTKFLTCGDIKNAITVNGSKMLELQAEKAWEIWNTP
ncbi:shikimate dehydrogenase [Mangrovimonas sp. YM274]|uniref:shikimate dehydrogenase family protein n=1 Tax=Mangrovimonas sp. YM274 TaxID=3070660 RepID=UPI0027DDF1E6|nr:shikimate dehydrogenase [Mangrovimonas sp. YM274]WMI67829.1 shikimate dehydrogenase [Mangrovimonas sp. YM274]